MKRKIILLTISSLIQSTILFGQEQQLTPPKPDFTFGANLILSNPTGDFKSTSISNQDAGFAEFGAGIGIFSHFEYKNGFFVEINADYTRRRSTAMDGVVAAIEEIFDEQIASQGLEYTARNNPGYRHLSLMIGPGFNFKTEDLDVYIRGEIGMAFTRLTASSIVDSNDQSYSFQSSDETVAAIGLGAGVVLFDVLRFDFSAVNLGNPKFRLRANDPSTEFSLPIQVFEIGVGLMIVK